MTLRRTLPCPTLQAWLSAGPEAQVRVEGEGLRTVELSLKDLQTRFKKHSITATLQCTGNRRDDLNAVKPVKGLEWSVGAPRAALAPACCCCRNACLDLQSASRKQTSIVRLYSMCAAAPKSTPSCPSRASSGAWNQLMV